MTTPEQIKIIGTAAAAIRNSTETRKTCDQSETCYSCASRELHWDNVRKTSDKCTLSGKRINIAMKACILYEPVRPRATHRHGKEE